ncbi:MAG: hypothetical protein JO193_08680 [Candidatus Eremiobacteraeota bacterium]|nr:hypothetical protein [Candidatus Eremiobacteraeota bacterium]
MIPRALLSGIAALIGAVAPALADSNTGMVNGYVYRANTHQPVCGVRVTAEADNQVTQQTYTDEHGFFAFISRFPGFVHVYADDSNPGAERLVDVHPMFVSEPVLYVGARATRAALERCARRLPAGRDR